MLAKSFYTIEFLPAEEYNLSELYVFSDLASLKEKVCSFCVENWGEFFEQFEGQYNVLQSSVVLKTYKNGDLVFEEDILPKFMLDIKGFRSVEYSSYQDLETISEFIATDGTRLEFPTSHHESYYAFLNSLSEGDVGLSVDWTEIEPILVSENLADVDDDLEIVLGNPVDWEWDDDPDFNPKVINAKLGYTDCGERLVRLDSHSIGGLYVEYRDAYEEDG